MISGFIVPLSLAKCINERMHASSVLMSICSTDVPALHIKETSFNIYNGPINAAITKTKCKRNGIEEQQRKEMAESDTKGQNFETSNNNAIYVCDAMRLLLFCSRCSAPHAYCIKKTIDEAHFYCCSTAVLAIF